MGAVGAARATEAAAAADGTGATGAAAAALVLEVEWWWYMLKGTEPFITFTSFTEVDVDEGAGGGARRFE